MIFTYRSVIDAPAQEVFDWHCRPGAFERLSPGFEQTRVLEKQGGIVDNGKTILEVKTGPFWRRWVAQHVDFDKSTRSFRDIQLSGPFKKWEHTHTVIPTNSNACVLEDRIDFAWGPGPIGKLARALYIEKKLQKVFRYRHALLAADLRRHLATPRTNLKIAVTGATGLVGGALCSFLSTGGHTVVPVTRGNGPALSYTNDTIHWDPAAKSFHLQQLEGFDAVIHLAGENIASKRWSVRQKAAIRDSRVESTRLLAESIVKLQKPPKVFVCASAIGYYGNRAGEILTEESSAGFDFLAGVCKEWEEAAAPAAAAGVRTVNLRFGVILAAKGGALKKMLLPFRLGFGGRVGTGDQWMSWISLEDVVAAIHFAIFNNTLSGPVNATAPHPEQNYNFTKTLGRVLRRPAIAPLPESIVQLAFGELGDALLLGGARVVPQKLQNAGFQFEHSALEGALRFELGM